MNPPPGTWLLCGVCAALSFLFSGMEAGVFALNRLRIRQLARANQPSARALLRFLDAPEDFLWTILIGNTLTNVVILGLGFLTLYGWLSAHPVWLLVAVLAFVLLFYTFLDLLPKMLFQQAPTRLCLVLARPFRVMHALLSPLVWLVKRASDLLLGVTGGRAFRGELFGNREELRIVMQEGARAFTSEEGVMINRVLDLPNRTVGSAVTPLAQATTVEAGTPVSEILALIRERSLTRLPVWGEADGKRRIIGIINADRLLYQGPESLGKKAADCVRPAVFLGERMRLDEALRRLQRSGQRLAVVLAVDGREMGILSLEDILMSLVGEVKL